MSEFKTPPIKTLESDGGLGGVEECLGVLDGLKNDLCEAASKHSDETIADKV